MTTKIEISQLIQKKIEYSRKDSFLNHFKTILHFQLGLSGEVNSDGFKIWTYSHWVGVFYPVFQGRINSNQGKTEISISSKLNSFGSLFAMLLSICWIILVLSMVLQGDNSWTYLWKRSLLGVILFITPYATFGYAVYRQHQIERKEIINECQEWVKCIIS